MKLTHMDHIALISSDADAALRFYTTILGFQIIRDTERPERGDRLILLEGCGCRLELFIKPDAPRRLSYPEARGLRHLAFHVESAEAAAAELRAKGVDVEPIRKDDLTGGSMTFIQDPDGLPIEFRE